MDLPQGWIEKISSKTGKTYYFNTNTGQSQWEPPSNEAQESVRVRHILQKHAGSRRQLVGDVQMLHNQRMKLWRLFEVLKHK